MVALAPIEKENAPLNAAEFTALQEKGAFGDAHVELLKGEVYFRMGQNALHVHTIILLLRRLQLYCQGEYGLGSQGSLKASEDSVPEPDAFVVRFAEGTVPEHYTLADAVLVVEVADSSLRRDRGIKASIYAEAEVPEYWIINPVAMQVEIRRKPIDGTYSETLVFVPGESISPLFAPDQPTAVSGLMSGDRRMPNQPDPER